MLKIEIPQIIFIILMSIKVGIRMQNHGKFLKSNFWDGLIGIIILIPILYYGGFFTK